MKYLELKNELQNEILPIYIIKGEDLYLKKESIKLIKSAVISDNEELNTAIFDAENFDALAVINACNTLPFFADRKLVLVKDFDQKQIDKFNTLFIKYCESPNTTTCLVIVDNDGVVKNTKNACIVDCSKLTNDNIMKWIKIKFRQDGITIEDATSNYLVDVCNNDMNKVSLEVDKLESYVKKGGTVTIKDIDDLSTKTQEYQTFELTNALGQKNTECAIKILENMLKDKKNSAMILGLIYSHFRRLFYVAISDENDEELSKLLNVKPYAILKSRQQLRLFSKKQLLSINKLCVEIDYKIKSGQLNFENALYYLVYNIV